MNKLYLLTQLEFEYDEFDAKLIRAESEEQAREIANVNTGWGDKVWHDHSKVTCEIITSDGEPGEVITSFNAG